MRTKTTLPISEARKNIFSIAEKVQKDNVYYTLTERGKPKMVMLSAEKFEKLIEKKDPQMLLSDKPLFGYGNPPSFFPKTLIIRDESRVVYLSAEDQNAKYQEEGLIKAQLFVELIEKHHYPLESIELGRYVRVGGKESKRYIEADVIINDQRGNARCIFEVSTFSEYEENTDRVVADLFDIAAAVSWVKKPEYLVYYSRAFKNGKKVEKILTVDYQKFNTFYAWKKSGRVGNKFIPELS